MSRPLRSTLALLGFLAIAGFFLWSEHRAHLLGALPFVLVLACPLLHLLHGHGGHTDHAGVTGEHPDARTDVPPSPSELHRHGR